MSCQNLILVLFIAFTNQLFGQIWEQTEAFPGSPRDDISHFTIGDKHYFGTGREVGFGCTRDFYALNSSTKIWESTAPLPNGKERQYASSISWNGKGYLFGGIDCSNTYLNDLWCYDPNVNSWSALPDLPSIGRAGMVSFILADTFYIVGGRNSEILSEVWGYDLHANSWSQKSNLPNDGIWRGVAFSYSNEGFIGLGRNNLNNQTAYNTSFYKYSADTDTWSLFPEITISQRSYAASVQRDSLVYFFGGVLPNGTISTEVFKLNLENYSIQTLLDFTAVPRKGGALFIMDNDLYFTTGVSIDTRFNETWRLTDVVSQIDLSSLGIKAYPNPVDKRLTLEASHKIEKIAVYNAMGILKMFTNCNVDYCEIETSNLPNGLYFLRMESGNSTQNKVFIVYH